MVNYPHRLLKIDVSVQHYSPTHLIWILVEFGQQISEFLIFA
jgi:hypothetical protein